MEQHTKVNYAHYEHKLQREIRSIVQAKGGHLSQSKFLCWYPYLVSCLCMDKMLLLAFCVFFYLFHYINDIILQWNNTLALIIL